MFSFLSELSWKTISAIMIILMVGAFTIYYLISNRNIRDDYFSMKVTNENKTDIIASTSKVINSADMINQKVNNNNQKIMKDNQKIVKKINNEKNFDPNNVINSAIKN